jgi:hypothetical protein
MRGRYEKLILPLLQKSESIKYYTGQHRRWRDESAPLSELLHKPQERGFPDHDKWVLNSYLLADCPSIRIPSVEDAYSYAIENAAVGLKVPK